QRNQLSCGIVGEREKQSFVLRSVLDSALSGAMSSETLASLQTTAPPRNGARVRPKRLSSFLVLEPPQDRSDPARLTSDTRATIIPIQINQTRPFFSIIWIAPL